MLPLYAIGFHSLLLVTVHDFLNLSFSSLFVKW